MAAPPAVAQLRFGGNEAGGVTGMRIVSYRDMPFRTVVRQQYDFSCGSAALATLLTYHYGLRTSETDAFKAMYDRGDQAKIRRAGFSLLDMQTYLRDRGFQSDGFRMKWSGLADLRAPAIVMVVTKGYRHFVVVKGVRDNRILLGDPALGLKTYSRAEFEAMWNGVAFVIRDGRTKPEPGSSDEWGPQSPTPWSVAYSSATLAEGLSREALSLYQITPVFNLDAVR